MAQVAKSTYMTSATGRMPHSAAPRAVPTMPASEIGVWRMRPGNFSSMPRVTAYGPPWAMTSSPSTIMLSSRSISSWSASRNASRMLFFGISLLLG